MASMATSTFPGPPALRRTSFSSRSMPSRVLGKEASWAIISPWGVRAVAACLRLPTSMPTTARPLASTGFPV